MVVGVCRGGGFGAGAHACEEGGVVGGDDALPDSPGEGADDLFQGVRLDPGLVYGRGGRGVVDRGAAGQGFVSAGCPRDASGDAARTVAVENDTAGVEDEVLGDAGRSGVDGVGGDDLPQRPKELVADVEVLADGQGGDDAAEVDDDGGEGFLEEVDQDPPGELVPVLGELDQGEEYAVTDWVAAAVHSGLDVVEGGQVCEAGIGGAPPG